MKQALFITHPDFAALQPLDVFHKEMLPLADARVKTHPAHLQNRHILFRRTADLPDFQKAVLRISADDHYKLYVNGTFVTEGPAPAYPSAYYYNEVNLTDILHPGRNVFAVHTYYQGLINRVWVSGDLRQMLWCTLLLDDEPVLVSDESWLCADHTGYTADGRAGYDTAFLERYDSRAPEASFASPSFDDSRWGRAAVRQFADYTLRPQPGEALVYENLRPRTVTSFTENGLHGLRLDFGQEAVGWLTMDGYGKAGDVVTLRCGEELHPDGSVRYHLRCNCVYEEHWVLADGHSVPDPYDYKAFRYAEILLPPGDAVENITFVARHYPFTRRAVYPTLPDAAQNENLHAILHLCEQTARYGTQEQYLDCPTREKGQYLGDVSIAARAQAALTGDTTLMKKAIREFARSAFVCDGLLAVSNASLMQEIADYSLQYPGQIAWVYAMDHDLAFVRELEPAVTALYHYFTRYRIPSGAHAGLLEQVRDKWNLVDWPANLRDGYDFPLTKPIGPGVHNVLNAFWIGFLEAMEELYTLLGKPEAAFFARETAAVKETFVRTFYDAGRGLFCDTPAKTHAAVHANLLPLLFDIHTPSIPGSKTAWQNRLCTCIAGKGPSSMGVYMAYFALAALRKAGREDLVLSFTLDDGAWMRMLREGATVTFEAWGRDEKNNCSLFHPWASAPAILFTGHDRIF